MATPSSRHVRSRSVPAPDSMSRTKGEYSAWMQDTGAIFTARRRVDEERRRKREREEELSRIRTEQEQRRRLLSAGPAPS